MKEDTINQLDPSWSELLKNTVSVETSHPSPKSLEKLKKEDLVVLKNLVAGKKINTSVHTGKAIVALVERSRTKEVAKLLGKVISDPERPESDRTVAAIEMRRLPKAEAEKVLIRNLAVEESNVQFRVIQSLGRIGGPEALKRLVALSEPKDSFVRRQWDFSKRLIQYRHGLKTKEPLRLSGTNWFIDSGTPPTPLPVRPLKSKRLKECLSTLQDKTLGAKLSDNPKFTLDLGANSYLILDQRFAKESAIKRLSEIPAISGVVVIWNEQTRSSKLSQVMLTTPDNGGVLIHCYRLDGSLRFEGQGSIRKGGFYFTLTSCERPGQCLYRISGKCETDGMKIDYAESLKLFPSKKTLPSSG